MDATGALRTVRTAADGRYRIPALAVGTYAIRCEKTGFQKAEIAQVYLGLNQTVEMRIPSDADQRSEVMAIAIPN